MSLCVCVLLAIESRASHMLWERYTTDLYPSALILIFKNRGRGEFFVPSLRLIGLYKQQFQESEQNQNNQNCYT
jgi:hypothetical protein